MADTDAEVNLARREERFANLGRVPFGAAVDHRNFLDEEGRDPRLASLSRRERKANDVEARKLAQLYSNYMNGISKSGVGYQVDIALREFALEYTNRYVASGLFSQPLSFNYIEPFCRIELFPGTIAPYVKPRNETNHLFNVTDFFDFLTSQDLSNEIFDRLSQLRENQIFHYTQNGSISDFTYCTPHGREFVIAGFSIIRHGDSVHWTLIGGEIFPETEWEAMKTEQISLDVDRAPTNKKAFLEEAMTEKGNTAGPAIALSGTRTAQRTIIAGETDLISHKHIGRCYMKDYENTFVVICDDAELFGHISNTVEREEAERQHQAQFQGTALMWGLAEAMFALPAYFSYKMNLAKSIVVKSGLKSPVLAPRGGRGIGAEYHYISALQVTDTEETVISSFNPPHYQAETNGHWRRLRDPKAFGSDAYGNQIQGKNWVKTKSAWRERSDEPATIYVKSTIAAAKVEHDRYLQAADRRLEGGISQQKNVVYVLRCLAMDADVYKVGFTTLSAQERAAQLSAETGVPNSFIVVKAWEHGDPEGLEEGIHAILAPYRINNRREFFQINYEVIEETIEKEILRTSRISP